MEMGIGEAELVEALNELAPLRSIPDGYYRPKFFAEATGYSEDRIKELLRRDGTEVKQVLINGKYCNVYHGGGALKMLRELLGGRK